MSDAGTAMQDIVSGVQSVSEIISQIHLATTEQANGIGEVNKAVAGALCFNPARSGLSHPTASIRGKVFGQADWDKTMMVFGDAKKVVEEMVKAIE